jgi:hypothetical protein
MVLEGARSAVVRFPLVIASALLAALAAVLGIDSEDGRMWARWFVTASLGLPLFFAVALFAERRARRVAVGAGARLLGLLGLGAFFFAWPSWSDPIALTRYFQLSIGLHLLAAFLPYVGLDENNGFWQYNRALFLRFLTAGIYSAVLFVGLAIALAALDNLLGVSVDEESYFRLFVLIGLVFNTWFFTAGVPEDLGALQRVTDYPRGLRVFAQFVLVPLVVVYLMIVTAYIARILITRVWPSGWIGYLVSALAALGILALLLVHPERERSDQRWIEVYARWFYVGLFPSIVMLLLAIWKRIDQYGVTEHRYLLTVLALWLAGIALFYSVTRSRNIRVIPTTLALLAFLTFVGPWSAYAVSRASQRERLEGLLERSGVLVDGIARAATTEVPAEDREQMTAVLWYLVERHGTGSIDPWFEGRLAEIDSIGGTGTSGRGEARERANLIMRHLGMEPVGPGGAQVGEFVSYQAQARKELRPLRGFDFGLTSADLLTDRFTAGADTIDLSMDESENLLRISRNGLQLLEISLAEFLERAEGARILAYPGDPSVEPDAMRIEAVGEEAAATIYVTAISLRRIGDQLVIQSAQGDVYVRLAPEAGR